MKSNWHYIGVILVLTGIIIFLSVNKPAKLSPPIEIRENSSEYHYINPLLLSRSSKDFFADEYSSLNAKLEAFVKEVKSSGKATSVSIYYRDLNSGHWTGENETQVYHPSSMLKVLGLMAYYRLNEEQPGILSRRIYYKPSTDEGQHYKPVISLTEGIYTIQTLIEHMITYSDNSVLPILDKEDTGNEVTEVYTKLQLPLAPNVDDIDGFMSPRSYSALFRALYNGTYLTKSDSEKALALLTTTTFDRGIVAGVPAATVVAHKFGEHTYEDVKGKIERHELHDCGIVYYPGHPYLICIMTAGSDFSKLEGVISSASALIYSYVDSISKK